MRNILISFLGTGRYNVTKYRTAADETLETRFVQEAICENIDKEDLEVYICLTDSAKKGNWIGASNTDGDDSRGLRDIFEEKNISYKVVEIRDGKSESEIWENFDRIFNIFNKEDKVYLDITHSFRSIPIMMMAILNYAKFTKDIEVENIFYGAYEARDQDDVSPIFDLTLFDAMTDWTIGVDEFMHSGDGGRLNKAINRTRGNIFKTNEGDKNLAKSMADIGKGISDFTKGIYTVRGLEVGETGRNIKENLSNVDYGNDYKFKPFENINDQVERIFSNFGDSQVENIYEIMKLCHEFGLIQQGFTFMEENITNFLIELYLGKEKMDDHISDINFREDIDKVLMMQTGKEDESYSGNCINIDLASEKMKPYLSKDLSHMFREIKGIRNDLNHSGFNGNPIKFDTSKKKLKEFIDKFYDYIIKPFYKAGKIEELGGVSGDDELGGVNELKLGLLFSHSLTENQKKDAADSLAIENLLALPEDLQEKWSNVPVDLDNLDDFLEPIKLWVEENFQEGDYILVQGDFGASYKMVKFLKERGYIPIYSTSKRSVVERKGSDGDIIVERVFSHEAYRAY